MCVCVKRVSLLFAWLVHTVMDPVVMFEKKTMPQSMPQRFFVDFPPNKTIMVHWWCLAVLIHRLSPQQQQCRYPPKWAIVQHQPLLFVSLLSSSNYILHGDKYFSHIYANCWINSYCVDHKHEIKPTFLLHHHKNSLIDVHRVYLLQTTKNKNATSSNANILTVAP